MNFSPRSVEEANSVLRQCKVKTLDCSNMKLADAGCLVLSAGLKTSTTLQILLLRQQKIGLEGIKFAALSISRLPHLRELNFYRNSLGEVGVNHLANLLASNCSTLQCLWLGDNRIREFPRSLLKITSLQRLHLNENDIEHVPNELALLPSLKLVDLDYNRLSGIPESTFYSGLTRFAGPRWELLQPHLIGQMRAEDEQRKRREQEEAERKRQTELAQQSEEASKAEQDGQE